MKQRRLGQTDPWEYADTISWDKRYAVSCMRSVSVKTLCKLVTIIPRQFPHLLLLSF